MSSRTYASRRVGGRAVIAILALLSVATLPVGAQEFRRGDADDDGFAATIIDILYLDGYTPIPVCLAAADANDDGAANIADALFLFDYAVGDGPMPPAPGPFDCGPDLTGTPLSCDSYDSCDEVVEPEWDPQCTLHAPNLVFPIGGEASALIRFDSLAAEPTRGLSFGVCHDPAYLAIEDVTPGYHLDADVYSTQIYESGFTAMAVIAFSPGSPLAPGSNYHLFSAHYQTLALGTSSLDFCEALGDPVMRIRAVRGGLGFLEGSRPTTISGSITVVSPVFRRGDANNDGAIDIADPISMLGGMFPDGPQPVCADAGDANDDGGYDIADPIYVLSFIFVSGAAPPAPGLVCGLDPTEDGLDCDQSFCH